MSEKCLELKSKDWTITTTTTRKRLLTASSEFEKKKKKHQAPKELLHVKLLLNEISKRACRRWQHSKHIIILESSEYFNITSFFST